MGSMSIDGLASGLNTTQLVSQLMQVEAIPQTQLKAKVASTNKVITALQGLNTRLASLVTAGEKLANSKTWSALKATSSDASVAVSTAAGASAGTLTFDVLKVAQAHSEASGEIAWADDRQPDTSVTTTLNLNRGGTTTAISVQSDDPRALAAAVNDADAGVRATAIQVRPGVYRLQLSSTETGTATAFSFDIDGVASNTVRQGQDAELSLGGDFTVRSSTNTFTNVLSGTTFTVSKPVTGASIAVESDHGAITAAASALVGSLNTVLQEIQSQTRAPVQGTTTTAGTLIGNSTVRQVTQSLLSAASGAIGDDLVASTGLQITRGGTVTFDEAKFNELVATDPARTQALVTALANQIAAVAKDASKPTDGSISQLITSRQGTVRDLDTQIESWDRRLELRESALKRQFSALEVALSNMQSQSTWLAGQLAGLMSNSKS
jgi:flagellar hook-associated protein 2